MFGTQSLPTTVDALEKKAKEQKHAQDTKHHVSIAKQNISKLNEELDELADHLRKLNYYKTVLEEAFGGPAPIMTNDAVNAAIRATEVNQAELLENVQSDDITKEEVASNNSGTGETSRSGSQLTEVDDQVKRIQSAKKRVENVIDRIKSLLKNGGKDWMGREDWLKKIRAAKQLQSILENPNSEFERALERLQRLLKKKLMDHSGSASTFVNQWESATRDWKKHQSLQSFENFQRTHDLSDSTVEEIRKLSKSHQLTLAEVSVGSLREMKSVDQLEAAVKLSL